MTTIFKMLAAAEEVAIARIGVQAGLVEVRERLATVQAELSDLEGREIDFNAVYDASIADLATLGVERATAERLVGERIQGLQALGLIEALVPPAEDASEKTVRRRRAKKEDQAPAEPLVPPAKESEPVVATLVSGTPLVAPAPETPKVEVAEVEVPKAPEKVLVTPPAPAVEQEVIPPSEGGEVPEFASDEQMPAPSEATVVTPEFVVDEPQEPKVVLDGEKASIIDAYAGDANGDSVWGSHEVTPSDAELEAALAQSQAMEEPVSEPTTAASRVNRPQEASPEAKPTPAADRVYGDVDPAPANTENAGSAGFDFLNFSAPGADAGEVPEFM